MEIRWFVALTVFTLALQRRLESAWEKRYVRRQLRERFMGNYGKETRVNCGQDSSSEPRQGERKRAVK